MDRNQKATIITCTYQSPCGVLRLGALGGKLCLCNWLGGKRCQAADGRLMRLLSAEMQEGCCPTLIEAASQLDEYFARRRRAFSVELLFAGSDFQRRVWEELLSIPYGSTVSYGEMARRIGRPRSVRAVANANGANAISIFAPCHRVIGSDGSLTGYAGGLSAKEFLLELENRC